MRRDAESKFRDDLVWFLEHVVACLDGLGEAEANWRPPAKDANSMIVIASHTLGAAEAHVLQLLCGQDIGRVRAREFAASGAVEPMREKLAGVIARISAALDGLDPAELDRGRSTPGGPSNGRGVLLWAVSHAAQHYGAAQLTRTSYSHDGSRRAAPEPLAGAPSLFPGPSRS